MKICTKCHESKEPSDFYRDSSKADGMASMCRKCKIAAAKDWITKNPDFHRRRYWKHRDSERERHLIRKYGVTLDDYRSMLEAQGGACAICRRPEPPNRMLDVDHCHTTGAVRGLLCTSCNRMLGHAGDSAARLRAGAKYLTRSSRKQQPSSSVPRSKRGSR